MIAQALQRGDRGDRNAGRPGGVVEALKQIAAKQDKGTFNWVLHQGGSGAILPKIKAIRETRSDAESVVYLRGDKDVCYTDMMKLLGYIRTAGFKANIVIVPEQGS